MVTAREPRTRIFPRMRTFYVYILASPTRVLYVGVTNDLARRVHEHRSGVVHGFTHRYHVHRLVYYETAGNPRAAIAREKQIKSWRRVKKVRLIEQANPTWEDLLPPVIPSAATACPEARKCGRGSPARCCRMNAGALAPKLGGG